jgi:hypothetical protein
MARTQITKNLTDIANEILANVINPVREKKG